MNKIAERCFSFAGFLFYILAGTGLLRTVAVIVGKMGGGNKEYLYAVAVIAAAGLLLIYLPLRFLSMRITVFCKRSTLPGKMEWFDWCLCLLFEFLLVLLRFLWIPISVKADIPLWFYQNLFCQIFTVLCFYIGLRRIGNRMMAIGSSLAVLLMPSFINSINVRETQNLSAAVIGFLLLLFTVIMKDDLRRILLFTIICTAGMTVHFRFGVCLQSRSMVPAEYVIIILFYLFACTGCLIQNEANTFVVLMYQLPFVLLFIISYFYKAKIQEQGLMHILLGISAGGAVSQILLSGQKDTERSRDMNNEERKTENCSDVMPDTPQKKKPAPGEYLENPLPVPKRHVKKEMGYAFEPESEKLCYDVSVSEDDDFDLP